MHKNNFLNLFFNWQEIVLQCHVAFSLMEDLHNSEAYF